jgi:hypothetical protein
MKSRIGLWAGAGALVVVFWALYIHATIGNPTLGNPLGAHGVMWAVICSTCPIALASRHPLSIYQVLAANAATYALVGAAVETMRRYSRMRSMAH